MGKKIRVYELAQKMGVDNKVLLEKLHEAGIDAKSHMSVLSEEDVEKLDEAPAKVERVEERRITAGVIRRRRKEVPQEEKAAPPAAAEEPSSVDTAVAEEAPAEEVQPVSDQPEIAVEPPPAGKQEEVAAPAPEPKAEEPVVEEVIAEPAVEEVVEEPSAVEQEEHVETTPVAEEEPKVEEQPSVEAESKAVSGELEESKTADQSKGQSEAAEVSVTKEKPKVEKATANRAKILGRVELSTLTSPPKRQERAKNGKGRPERPKGAKPSGGPAPRAKEAAPQAAVPFDGGPAPDKEVRGGKKGKKGKGNSYDKDKGFADGGKGRRARRQVYEPERDERRMRRGKKTPKPQKKTEVTVSKAIKRIIRISDVITVGELAKRMGVKSKDLITELMRQGQMVTINHPLDFETAAILASEFNYEVENVAFDEENLLADTAAVTEEGDSEEGCVPRPPVVTIMGHVDHGKTSLLDAIRATNVTGGEAGGITQHIGAYDVSVDDKKITFLDTPGHEAFTSMRARGAKVTDIVILVVAADDGVMPQTKEAINHSKAAGVPIIVAVNKMDKPDANSDRVKQELTEFEMIPEEWGGDTIFVEVSAKNRTNLDSLLEMVLLQAEVLELKANPNKRAKGAIVEARLDRGRGPVATVLVEEGTLRIGDPIVSGLHYGKVRTMTNDRGERLEEAGPACPVEVTGLSGTPTAGDSFHAVESEKDAKEVATHRQRKVREQELASTSKISLEQLYARMQEGEVQELKVIIKADVQGSVEAVRDSLVKLSTDACRLVVIHTAVGGINESDVSLASASDAIILGFNVRAESKAAALAETEGVDIRFYNVIYDAVNDIRDAMEGLLAPTLREKHLGKVEVRETFHVSKVGTIAGCYVTEGKVLRNAQVRLIRDHVVIWEGKLASLKRFKDDAREVQNGYECGLSLENYNDIKVGDIIEVFEMEEVKTSL
ncbi:translation initiation factor IF-2 [Syntrophotalea carbinolica DSM 2380]|uniref:Translation initiation factor IF-2 n=1 Tax=Syntrophotalea carbinolica (strain DSM 2380 / NBRC 103641 / GraBd1) TaxID=338963 RepID=IF2_SYNC1|nr:translation initiation factor IF-2 [Syntrophotalea carbinolica]Q3A4A7.1 RecName: Full=Translation initiation factor IF-2 [Syntrophotalea carbinolica DSM 2380]ABA88800.1 translation initiation factor IF-2 [Syntrophotalea carbinolica DSM 2380]